MEAPSFTSRGRAQLMRLADWAAVGVAVMLPWSTTATAVFIVVWMVTFIPTLDVTLIRESFAQSARDKSAGQLPVLLWAVTLLGMFWANAPWPERVAGAAALAKLVPIPFLAAQFYRSTGGKRVLLGFLASATALLFLSWALVLLPGLPWRGRSLGVPVKDYLEQSEIFVLCAFALLHCALRMRLRNRYFALALLLLAGAFLANVGYVATARTALAVFAILLIAFGNWHFGWKGIAGALVLLGLVAALLWSSSPSFRGQFLGTLAGIEGVSRDYVSTSTGARLEIWHRSVDLMREAPLIGHGTGSIPQLFGPGRPAPAGKLGSINPHSEIFRIGIQTGLLGLASLIAMWISHLMLFHRAGPIGWIGSALVIENIVSSMFNSHLSDFTQGWLYVFGVGVLGGTIVRECNESAVRPLGS
jgi:O-antigen ligase